MRDIYPIRASNPIQQYFSTLQSDIAAFKNFTAADAGASGAVTEEAPAAAEAPKSPEQQQAPVAEAKQQVSAPQSSGMSLLSLRIFSALEILVYLD